jgi:hypothetical protein
MEEARTIDIKVAGYAEETSCFWRARRGNEGRIRQQTLEREQPTRGSDDDDDDAGTDHRAVR